MYRLSKYKKKDILENIYKHFSLKVSHGDGDQWDKRLVRYLAMRGLLKHVLFTFRLIDN